MTNVNYTGAKTLKEFVTKNTIDSLNNADIFVWISVLFIIICFFVFSFLSMDFWKIKIEKEDPEEEEKKKMSKKKTLFYLMDSFHPSGGTTAVRNG